MFPISGFMQVEELEEAWFPLPTPWNFAQLLPDSCLCPICLSRLYTTNTKVQKKNTKFRLIPNIPTADLMAADKTHWRRTWKPDISALPWMPLRLESDRELLIKAHITREVYSFIIFDGYHTWSETCSNEEVVSKAKKFNPNVEAPVSTLLQHLDDCVHLKGLNPSFTLQHTKNETLTLAVSSHLTGRVPFKWNVVARKTSNTELADHVINPLLCMVSELLKREKALVATLKRKDVEIEDLKAGGAKVSRKKLETTPFNHKAFQQEMVHSKEFENIVSDKHGKKCFQEEGQTLYREIMTTASWLNHSKELIDDDDDDNSLDGAANMQSFEPTKTAAASPSWANKVPPSMLGGNASAGSSPASHPGSRHGSPRKVASPGNTEDLELMRREALERKLAEEKEKEAKKTKTKKRKKMF